jgi:hypothetical protein
VDGREKGELSRKAGEISRQLAGLCSCLSTELAVKTEGDKET